MQLSQNRCNPAVDTVDRAGPWMWVRELGGHCEVGCSLEPVDLHCPLGGVISCVCGA